MYYVYNWADVASIKKKYKMYLEHMQNIAG